MFIRLSSRGDTLHRCSAARLNRQIWPGPGHAAAQCEQSDASEARVWPHWTSLGAAGPFSYCLDVLAAEVLVP